MRDGMNRMDGGIPRPFRAGSDADAQAIFGAFTTPPDDTRKGLINAYVLALKAGGVWNSLDGLYVFAAADSQAALINWRNPGTHDATLVNAPTFTQDRGFTGNGTNSYVNSNFNPSTAGGLYVQNSAHISARSLTDLGAGNNNQRLIGIAANDATARALLLPRNTSNQVQANFNSPNATAGANTDASDLFTVNRSGASAVEVYKGARRSSPALTRQRVSRASTSSSVPTSIPACFQRCRSRLAPSAPRWTRQRRQPWRLPISPTCKPWERSDRRNDRHSRRRAHREPPPASCGVSRRAQNAR